MKPKPDWRRRYNSSACPGPCRLFSCSLQRPPALNSATDSTAISTGINMKIGILAAGTTPDELTDRYDSYAQMFINLFGKAGAEFEYAVFDVRDDIFPQSAAECDGINKQIKEKKKTIPRKSKEQT